MRRLHPVAVPSGSGARRARRGRAAQGVYPSAQSVLARDRSGRSGAPAARVEDVCGRQQPGHGQRVVDVPRQDLLDQRVQQWHPSDHACPAPRRCGVGRRPPDTSDSPRARKTRTVSLLMPGERVEVDERVPTRWPRTSRPPRPALAVRSPRATPPARRAARPGSPTAVPRPGAGTAGRRTTHAVVVECDDADGARVHHHVTVD